MKRSAYYRGVPGRKYGIWNSVAKCFQFNICEDTPMLAEARLYQKIGDDARKYRFEPRMLPGAKQTECGCRYCTDVDQRRILAEVISEQTTLSFAEACMHLGLYHFDIEYCPKCGRQLLKGDAK